MNRVWIKQLRYVMCVAAFLFGGSASYAGENKGDEKDYKLWSKEERQSNQEKIMREISFLAKKLLDINDKESLEVSSPAVMKPFLGVCSMVAESGVKLTCITPASQAEKNGLKTGDIIQSINGISMVVMPKNDDKHPYWNIVHNMKTGDIFQLNVLRSGETIKLAVTVGSLAHPAFELKINRD